MFLSKCLTYVIFTQTPALYSAIKQVGRLTPHPLPQHVTGQFAATFTIPVKRLLGEERASEIVSPARAEGREGTSNGLVQSTLLTGR